MAHAYQITHLISNHPYESPAYEVYRIEDF